MPFPAAMPHLAPERLFDDVWRVTGSVLMGTLIRLSRNMVIVRHDETLMLVNSVRLDQAGLAALDTVGKVEHVVKIGVHGMDDAFYVDRYGATRWCLPGVAAPDEATLTDQTLPLPGLRLFRFEHTVAPEAALLVEREGGILLTCDSVQHWEPMPFVSLPARIATSLMGFKHPAQIGPPWRKRMTPSGGTLRPDFERMAALPFTHLIGGHGGLLRDNAPQVLRASIERNFG